MKRFIMRHWNAAAARRYDEHVTPVRAVDRHEVIRDPFRRGFVFPRYGRPAVTPEMFSLHPDYEDRVVVKTQTWDQGNNTHVHVFYAELGGYVMLNDMSVMRRIKYSDELYRGGPK